MRLLALWMLASVLVIVTILTIVVALFASRLHRRNRVDPEVETIAPLLWLWSPVAPARLHRRLCDAIEPIHLPAKVAKRSPHDAPHAELRRTLAAQAVEIDRQLVLTSRLSRRVRREPMRAIQRQVHEVEDLSRRMRVVYQTSLAPQLGNAPARPAGPDEALAALRTDLALLEAAHAELAEIERTSTLADPEELLRRIEQPAPSLPDQPSGQQREQPQQRPSPG